MENLFYCVSSSTTVVKVGKGNNLSTRQWKPEVWQTQEIKLKKKKREEWVEQEIITTQCTNAGAVIEWLFVPFIVEDEEDDTRPQSADAPAGAAAGCCS